MSLGGSLLESPIPPKTRHIIVAHLWGTSNRDTLNSFVQYYTEQCRIAWSVNGSQMVTKRHQDILDIVIDINQGVSREGIKQKLVAKCLATNTTWGDSHLESAIDLAVRLLLMIDVGALQNSFSGRQRLLWKEGDGSLKDFAQEIFSDKPQSGHNGVKLGQSFTARTLDNVAGFRVELTANLADHLPLRDGKMVAIFHYASFLKIQQEPASLLPEGLAEETLLTLSLLFPRGDKDVVKWYYKQGARGS